MKVQLRVQLLAVGLFLLLSVTMAFAAWQAPPTAPTNSPTIASVPVEVRVAQLERTIFWLGMVCAVFLILPLPMCLYHFRRVGKLLVEIEGLQTKLHHQEAISARMESVVARNEKLETEIKYLQERFRISLENEQEKYQQVIEKLKSDLQSLDLENKRISGLLMLKESALKREVTKG
ncbi:MAG: hypothetical protein AB1489_28920 [Acidobacteriota bacterium]